VVFVSFFPDEADDYDNLKKSLERLKLNDSSFVYEPDFNEVLGRGFKGGFLGKLHFEIIAQRLDREFGIRTITSFPSVAYKVKVHTKFLPHIARDAQGYTLVQNPKDLPDEFDEILEPMIKIELVCPPSCIGSVLGLQESFRWGLVTTETLGDRVIIRTRMPLAELISDFDDRLKSISGGFASFSYEEDGYQKNDLARLDILVASDLIPGLSRILPRATLEREARKMVIRLKEVLPHQQFSQSIQGKAFGRFVARETIPAMKKDLGNFGKNGGDRTRKMKLWKKQKAGKKKLLAMAQVRIAPEDFKKLLSK
jgi:GTP-binding protein LepA